MPDRFCMPREGLSISEFANTHWGDLYVPGTRWVWSIDGSRKTGNSSAFGSALPPADVTPYDYWKQHVASWLDFADHRADVHVVDYALLTSSFQQEMERIAAYLGMENREFVDVKEKVGGQPI
ncbi:MAG: sulfotransferase domain-containing protein [Candidatus Thorarchaeota archaeon]